MVKRQCSVQKNQQDLNSKSERDYQRLEQKKKLLQNRQGSQDIQQKLIMANRLRLKQDMQRHRNESQATLEKVNRNPRLLK